MAGAMRIALPLDRRALLGLMATGAALSACGFHPLYGTSQTSQATREKLAAIRINDVGEGNERRVGQILKNDLINRMTAGIGSRPQRYDLRVTIKQYSSALQIQTTDTVTRYNLTLTADFSLYETATDKLLYSGTANSIGSYDVVESLYATRVAQQETARDAARELSGTIVNILALYFERHAG